MTNAWYPHYPGDYGRDTAHLSLVQHGAYRLLLDYYYATGGPLPGDRIALYRICRAFDETEKAAVDFVVTGFFQFRDGGYHNPRSDSELAKRAEHRERLSNAGKKRWKDKPQHEPGSSQAHSQAIASPQPQPHPYPKPLPDKKNPAPSALVPVGVWLAFVEMRKQIRRPMTSRAAELIHRKLAELKDRGNDPVEVLEQSIRNSWQDVFEIKREGKNGKPESFAERNIRRAQEELSEVGKRAKQVLQEVGGDLPESSDRSASGRILPGSIERPDTGPN